MVDAVENNSFTAPTIRAGNQLPDWIELVIARGNLASFVRMRQSRAPSRSGVLSACDLMELIQKMKVTG
jgi:hypothetical protein